MTDIVEQLNNWAECVEHDEPNISEMCSEAASEITRLREQVKRMERALELSQKRELKYLTKLKSYETWDKKGTSR